MLKIKSLIYFFTVLILNLYFTSIFAAQVEHPKAKSKNLNAFLNKITFNSQLELKYDSNVFNYSRDDIEEFESYDNPNKFNQIKEVDDFITSTTIGPRFKDKFLGHTLLIDIEVEPHFYSRNKIKDYESYRVELKQYLKKGEYLEFDYNFIPKFFLKNLWDRDFNEYRKGSFDKSLYSLGYKKPLNTFLDVGIKYIYEENNYNGNFDEYDSSSNAVNLSIWHRINDYLRSKFYFEFEGVDAVGDMGDTARIELDPSYDKYEAGYRETVKLTKRTDFYAQYVMSYRDYTTDNALSDDPYHTDRQDKIQNIGFGLDYNVNNSLKVFLEYKYTIKDVNTAAEDPVLINASVLGYEKSTLSCGVSYKF